MGQNIYIKVKSSYGNWNIWEITEKILIGDYCFYKIQSRTTIALVEAKYCFCEYGSPLLYYDNGDETVDVESSNIEVETIAEYRKWKKQQNININPFAILDELDFGYLEDLSEEEKWDHLKGVGEVD